MTERAVPMPMPAIGASPRILREPAPNAATTAYVQLLSDAANGFEQAVRNRVWDDAALRLNGLSNEEVDSVLKKMDVHSLHFLRDGLDKKLAGWPRQAALLASIDKNIVRAGQGKSTRQILLERIKLLVTGGLYLDAVVNMGGLNQADVKGFLKSLDRATKYQLLTSAKALGWQTYVLTELEGSLDAASVRSAGVMGDFEGALRKLDLETMAKALNAMSDADLAKNLRRVPRASLPFALQTAALSAMPGYNERVLRAITALQYGTSLKAEERALIRSYAGGWTDVDIHTAFDHRFGIPLSSGWARTVLLAMWDKLDYLPDAAVTPSTIKQFEAQAGGGGAYGGGDIDIGQELYLLGNTVRHEVAHAVHAQQFAAVVDAWLAGFWKMPTASLAGGNITHGTPEAEITELVKLFGGFTSANTAKQTKAITDLGVYFACFDGFSGSPGKFPKTAHGVISARAEDTLRRAGTHFWFQYQSWPVVGGYHYFYNPYYKATMGFNATVLSITNMLEDSYTSMSPMEFFANTYAEYFRSHDQSKWGQRLPKAISAWFKSSGIEPTTPFPGGPPKKKLTPR